MRLKAQWSARRYTSADQAMQSYFLKQASGAQYFTPKLDQYEINYSVVQQLPMRARDALVTIDYGDTNAVARALAQLDLSFEENRNRESRRSPPSHNSAFQPSSPNTSGNNRVSHYTTSSPTNNNTNVPSKPSLAPAYRTRRMDVEAAPWCPWPDMSVPPPIQLMSQAPEHHEDGSQEGISQERNKNHESLNC